MSLVPIRSESISKIWPLSKLRLKIIPLLVVIFVVALVRVVIVGIIFSEFLFKAGSTVPVIMKTSVIKTIVVVEPTVGVETIIKPIIVISLDHTRAHAEVHTKVSRASENVFHTLWSDLGEDDLLKLVGRLNRGLVTGTVLLWEIDTAISCCIFTALLDSSWSVWGCQLSWHPLVMSHFYYVLKQKLDPGGHLRVVDDSPDPIKVLVHAHLGFGRVEKAATGLHEMSKTFDILGLVVERLLPPAHQQLFRAPMQNRVVEHLQLAQFTNKLDIAKHFALGQISRFFFFGGQLSSFLESCGNSCSILELIFALVKQQAFKGGNLRFRGFQVWCIVREPLAQLCVHGTILWFIESFFKYQ